MPLSQDSISKSVNILTNSESVVNLCCQGWLLLIIILITGVIGGIINYLLKDFESSKNEALDRQSNNFKMMPNKEICLQILLGICGSSLIPLLLYLTSSKLFNECDNCFFTYFVFAGYCFIGAIFSRALLKSLAKRLDLEKFQEDLKKNSEKSNYAENYIKDKLKDDDEEETITEQTRTIPIKDINIEDYAGTQGIEDLRKVLEELRNPKYKDRSINGLIKKTKLSKDTVFIMLKVLIRLGLVQDVNWYGNTFYRLTKDGKTVTFTD